MIPAALSAMAEYRQFLTYILVPQPDGKMNKIPTDPRTGKACDPHNPSTWVDYETASAAGPVAFVFTDQDPFFFFDIDHCKQPDGQWNSVATWACQQFAGCAVEVSQSGEGLHIFGVAPEDLPHGCNSDPLNSQFYTSKRFVALTFTGLTGDISFTPPVETYRGLISNYFTQTPGSVVTDANWTTEPDPEWYGPEDDSELMAKAFKSKSAKAILGVGVTLKQLWEADEAALAGVYPSDNDVFNWSQADAALCSHLAFWTGKDCERIQRLWEASALGQRDKFHDRPGYVQTTILRAVSMCKAVYKGKKPLPEPAPYVAPTDCAVGEVRLGYQFLAPEDQLSLFDGCVYVLDIHQSFVPSGDLLKPEQFRALYGGYNFALDSVNSKTTKNAWEVFTESQALRFPKAGSICFRPELPPGQIIYQDGRALVNSYVPVAVDCTEGDAGPFLDLMNRLLPDPRDREVLLAYMAACVQHVGKKFQWAPLMQGAQGNGKTFIATCLSRAIGERYTHLVNPKDVGNVFNAWVQGKLLAVIEEVYTSDNADMIEDLKPLITNKRIPIQGKGANQTTGDNRANFFMCTNHKDAIKITRNDRRFCVFYTPQQEAEDIKRDGMWGNYFPELYEWGDSGGFAIVAWYLKNYQIPAALNPAGECHRAPITTSTEEAFENSLGVWEQKVRESCEEGIPGFIGGWVSSMAVSKLFDGKISTAKRTEILKNLGYESVGRANNAILYEGGKPVLYVKSGHLALNIKSMAERVRVYCEAQGYLAVQGVGGQSVAK